MTKTGMRHLSVTVSIKPALGGVPPSLRLPQSSIRPAPARSARIADSRVSTADSTSAKCISVAGHVRHRGPTLRNTKQHGAGAIDVTDPNDNQSNTRSQGMFVLSVHEPNSRQCPHPFFLKNGPRACSMPWHSRQGLQSLGGRDGILAISSGACGYRALLSATRRSFG